MAAVIDMFSRQVVGWSLQEHMQTSLVKDALAMAWWRRKPPTGVIFHSDRGSQYCSHEFQTALAKWKVRSSMSRKGNCWDNAPTESFWGRLKTACIHGYRFTSKEQARWATWTGWLSTITADCIQAWAISVRCSTSNASTRHSVKRSRKWKAKNSKKRGQHHMRWGFMQSFPR